MSKATQRSSRKELNPTHFLLLHQRELRKKKNQKKLRSRNDINI
jgi:hypothetical protein